MLTTIVESPLEFCRFPDVFIITQNLSVQQLSTDLRPIFEAPTCRNLPPKAPFCWPASNPQVASANSCILFGFLTAMFPARISFPAIDTAITFGQRRLLKRVQKRFNRIPGCVVILILDLTAAPAAFYRTYAFMHLLTPYALA